mmetsp:Transcript_39827/g.85260  ORF Transcript_39827/g.85260 Transcript_39827/m.85260 type:complete len:284 (+) Transcript_39827:59-910(+)
MRGSLASSGQRAGAPFPSFPLDFPFSPLPFPFSPPLSPFSPLEPAFPFEPLPPSKLLALSLDDNPGPFPSFPSFPFPVLFPFSEPLLSPFSEPLPFPLPFPFSLRAESGPADSERGDGDTLFPLSLPLPLPLSSLPFPFPDFPSPPLLPLLPFPASPLPSRADPGAESLSSPPPLPFPLPLLFSAGPWRALSTTSLKPFNSDPFLSRAAFRPSSALKTIQAKPLFFPKARTGNVIDSISPQPTKCSLSSDSSVWLLMFLMKTSNSAGPDLPLPSPLPPPSRGL